MSLRDSFLQTKGYFGSTFPHVSIHARDLIKVCFEVESESKVKDGGFKCDLVSMETWSLEKEHGVFVFAGMNRLIVDMKRKT